MRLPNIRSELHRRAPSGTSETMHHIHTDATHTGVQSDHQPSLDPPRCEVQFERGDLYEACTGHYCHSNALSQGNVA